MSAWTEHVSRWKDCQRCSLCAQRDRICLARGTIPADIVFIGEAPGASEDAIGQPFVGPAGQLMDAIIASALRGPLQQTLRIALTNLVACFPRTAKAEGINEPHMSEIRKCRPRLVEFVNLCQPRLIVCVGMLATQYIDHGDTVRCADIIHPAAILRMPLAQKQMATQRAVVTLRNAVEDMLESTQRPYTTWGERHAGKTLREQLESEYNSAELG